MSGMLGEHTHPWLRPRKPRFDHLGERTTVAPPPTTVMLSGQASNAERATMEVRRRWDGSAWLAITEHQNRPGTAFAGIRLDDDARRAMIVALGGMA